MNNMGFFAQAFKNPQEFLANAMQNNELMKNPIMQNTMQMMKKGDSKGLEDIARNLCKERGINPDEELKKIKSQFGM